MKTNGLQKRILIVGLTSSLLLFALLLWSSSKPPSINAYNERNRILEPVRDEPSKFPAGTHMPNQPEGKTSGSIDMSTFSAGRDLTYIDDPRVWWESDNDKNDDEDDHTINKAIEIPLKRVIELVCKNGGTLEVHDAFRPTFGIHSKNSLHREGRAVDLTCDQFSLEKLAKLCWMAGFDWVYHEKGNGPHIHCSVRRIEGTAASEPVEVKYKSAPDSQAGKPDKKKSDY